MNSYILPRQSGKTLTTMLNQILQNKLEGIPEPTHDKLYVDITPRYSTDKLYEENQNNFRRDYLYNTPDKEIMMHAEISGSPIQDILDSWLTGIADPFSKFFT